MASKSYFKQSIISSRPHINVLPQFGFKSINDLFMQVFQQNLLQQNFIKVLIYSPNSIPISSLFQSALNKNFLPDKGFNIIWFNYYLGTYNLFVSFHSARSIFQYSSHINQTSRNYMSSSHIELHRL